MEKRKAEVRKRLEEQSAKKGKKGFMTPERKKKLRVSVLAGLRMRVLLVLLDCCSFPIEFRLSVLGGLHQGFFY